MKQYFADHLPLSPISTDAKLPDEDDDGERLSETIADGHGTLLATEKSPLIWREYEEKVYHRAGQENFLREEIPDIKDKMKQDITSKALARAVEALEKLGATKTGSYKIVDHTYNDSLGNIWFSNKPTVSDGSISS
jgi:hypothetical protein